MEAICNDLNMNFVDTFSAKMYELTTRNTRKQLENFAHNFFASIKLKKATYKKYQPLIQNKFKYEPGTINEKINAQNKKILIITDSSNPETNQVKMLNQFKKSINGTVKIIDLNDGEI